MLWNQASTDTALTHCTAQAISILIQMSTNNPSQKSGFLKNICCATNQALASTVLTHSTQKECFLDKSTNLWDTFTTVHNMHVFLIITSTNKLNWKSVVLESYWLSSYVYLFNPLHTECKFSGQINRYVRYVYSCLHHVILICPWKSSVHHPD